MCWKQKGQLVYIRCSSLNYALIFVNWQIVSTIEVSLFPIVWLILMRVQDTNPMFPPIALIPSLFLIFRRAVFRSACDQIQ